MCFFHLQKIFKERLKNQDAQIKSEIIKDVNFMHFCKSEFEFAIAKYNIYNKWIKMGLTEFKEYLYSQWVQNVKFNKWVR
jgi:hypothetical protein